MNLTWGHLRSLRSKNGVKFWTILNGKTNTARVLVGVKHQKVSTVTSSPDLWLRGQRSKRSNRKQREMIKVTLSMCSSWSNIKKSQWWPLHPTYGKEVKGQKGQKWGQILNNLKWQNQHCQSVGRGQTSKSVRSDLFTWPMVKGSKVKKVKSQTTWNDKSNTVNVFILVKHQKKSTVTSSSDLRKRGQRLKRSNLK